MGDAQPQPVDRLGRPIPKPRHWFFMRSRLPIPTVPVSHPSRAAGRDELLDSLFVEKQPMADTGVGDDPRSAPPEDGVLANIKAFAQPAGVAKRWGPGGRGHENTSARSGICWGAGYRITVEFYNTQRIESNRRYSTILASRWPYFCPSSRGALDSRAFR